MTAYIGPIGGLVPLKCPSSLNLDVTRAQSLATTTGGRRVAFQAPRSHRSWSVDTSAATPSEVTAVQALEAGVYGPPPWHWVDPWAQVTNMLTPASSAFATGTFWGGGGPYVSDAPVTLEPGVVVRRSIIVPTPSSLVAVTGAPGSTYASVPVVPGLPVTVSLYGTIAASRAYMSATFLDAAGATISTHQATATAGIGGTQRFVRTITAPPGAATVRVTALNLSRIAAPQITWTPQATPWALGQGASAVIVDGVSATALRAVRNTPAQQLGANSFQVVEVG